MPNETGPTPVTTTVAMSELHLNRDQVVRLVETGILPERGRRGRARLLDQTALADLAGRRVLPDHPNVERAEVYALALHLGPLTREAHPDRNERTQVGWHATHPVPDEAWTGWWNTGVDIAAHCAEHQLPVLPAISGIVVEVRTITGWRAHPLYPGLVQLEVAPPQPDTLQAFTGTRFRPVPGAPWQRLWRTGDEKVEGAAA